MYSISYFNRVPTNCLDGLFGLFDEYVQELKEDRLTYENMCELANDLGVNLFFCGDKLAGFYLVSKEMSLSHRDICFVHHMYINEGHRGTKLIELAESHIIETAKSMGVSKIFYSTSRNPNAFVRLLKEKWKIDSVVISLSI